MSGSGSGSGFDPLNWKLRARVVDQAADGRKVLAFACGELPCNGGIHQGRLVDQLPDGRKVFAVASECRHAENPGEEPEIIAGCNAPFGIPNVLKARFAVDSECFNQSSCPVVFLTHNGAGGWVGTLPVAAGVIDLEFVCNADGSGTLNMTGACLTSDLPVAAVLECQFPYNVAGGAVMTVTAACCGVEPNPDVIVPFTFEIYGTSLDRYVGRLVDQTADGKKVFVVGECCVPDNECPVTETCCGCDASPRAWTFSIGGPIVNGVPGCLTDCGEFVGDWTVTYIGGCEWRGGGGNVCTPTPATWRLFCTEVGGVEGWLLQTLYPGGASYFLASTAWACFGPNTMTKTTTDAACVGFPGSVVLTAA